MSRRTRLYGALQGAISKMGGAHLTEEARERTALKFADVMFERGFTHLAKVEDIGGKHLRLYANVRREQNAGTRTLQNELAHLRCMIRKAGRAQVADAPELSNKALGISGGSRIGTKSALTDAELERVCALANELRRPGLAMVLTLERRLGLRGAEALHAKDDTLARWRMELKRDGRIHVISGTKGGRARFVNIRNVDAALSAIEEAFVIAKAQRGFLVVRSNGEPAGGLKQARSIYHSWVRRAGIQPHAARYAFAKEQLDAYKASGYGEREALVAVSHDLGHGDGRGRWVRSVYMPRGKTGDAAREVSASEALGSGGSESGSG